jgi:hypothetical protein
VRRNRAKIFNPIPQPKNNMNLVTLHEEFYTRGGPLGGPKFFINGKRATWGQYVGAKKLALSLNSEAHSSLGVTKVHTLAEMPESYVAPAQTHQHAF